MKVRRMQVAGAAVCTMIAVACGITSCGSAKGTHTDLPQTNQHFELPQAVNYANADDYPNISAFCVGFDGVYTTTREQGTSMQVVPNDPNCSEGGVLHK